MRALPKDTDKLNNHFENLEWVTKSENQLHAYQNKLRVSPRYWTGKKFSQEHKEKISKGIKRHFRETGLTDSQILEETESIRA